MSFGGVGVDHVGDLGHLALLHQQLDDIHAAFRHAVGEFLDGDRLGQNDFARKLVLLLRDRPFRRWVRRRNEATERVRSSSSPVALVTVRRPRFFVSAPVRVGRGAITFGGIPGRRMTRLASSSSRAGARRRGRSQAQRAERRGRGRASGGAARGAAVVAGAGGGPPPSRRRLRFLLSAALGFGLVRAARFFFALARFGGLALFAFAAFALCARWLRSRRSPLLLLALAGAGERAGTGLALFLGQGAQDDAGCGRCAARPLRLGAYALRLRGARLHGAAARRGRCRRGASRGGCASPGPACGVSPSRRRPPWCGHARSSGAQCPARPVASATASWSGRRSECCRRNFSYHSFVQSGLEPIRSAVNQNRPGRLAPSSGLKRASNVRLNCEATCRADFLMLMSFFPTACKKLLA